MKSLALILIFGGNQGQLSTIPAVKHAEGVFVRVSVAGQGPLDGTNLNLIQSSQDLRLD